MKKRLIIAAAAAVVIGLVLYLVYGRHDDKGVIRVSGIMEGIEVNLSSKVPGRIQSTCCSEGDTVQEGQIAVELNSDELRAAVAQATAGVERAKADIAFAESAVENAKALVQSADAAAASAKAEVEKARVQLAERKREMERSQELFQKAYISRESFDLAVTAHDTAAAALTAAQAQVNAAHAQRAAAAAQVNAANGQLSSSRARLKEAEAGLEVSQARLRDMVIISPVTGAVTFKALEKGEYAAAGVTIMTVVDPASLYVRIDLEETVVVGVPLHASARITAEGLTGKEFTGRVVEIGRYAEFATQRDVTRGRQDIRTFRVKVKPEDPNGLLKPGMTVFAEIRKKT